MGLASGEGKGLLLLGGGAVSSGEEVSDSGEATSVSLWEESLPPRVDLLVPAISLC